MTSPQAYNNGQWHQVEVVRVGAKGVLKVDGETIQTDSAPGPNQNLKVIIVYEKTNIISVWMVKRCIFSQFGINFPFLLSHLYIV